MFSNLLEDSSLNSWNKSAFFIRYVQNQTILGTHHRRGLQTFRHAGHIWLHFTDGGPENL